MVLDSEIHRTALLSLIDSSTFRGADLKAVVQLREAIERAAVAPPNVGNEQKDDFDGN
jgi:hypothetical protein